MHHDPAEVRRRLRLVVRSRTGARLLGMPRLLIPSNSLAVGSDESASKKCIGADSVLTCVRNGHSPEVALRVRSIVALTTQFLYRSFQGLLPIAVQ